MGEGMVEDPEKMPTSFMDCPLLLFPAISLIEFSYYSISQLGLCFFSVKIIGFSQYIYNFSL